LIAVWIMHAYSGSSSVGGEPVVASRSSSAEESAASSYAVAVDLPTLWRTRVQE
jgi:hypothetical protein